MALITSKITYYRSTAYSFDVTITPPSGLTAQTILFTVKTNPDDNATDSTALIKKNVTMSANKGTIDISPTDISDSVDAQILKYSIHIVMSDGKPYPFAAGNFDLKVTTTNRET